MEDSDMTSTGRTLSVILDDEEQRKLQNLRVAMIQRGETATWSSAVRYSIAVAHDAVCPKAKARA